MKKFILSVFVLVFAFQLSAQEKDARVPLRGKVLYRNVNVPNQNVINTTAETTTISNDKGEFLIDVKIGDELVFMAVNYQIKIVKVTEKDLKRNRLVVEVKEKVMELDEVVVTPENQKKFIELKNEEFKEVEYEIDRTTQVVNIADGQRSLQDGLNFVSLYKLLAKAIKGDKKKEKTTKLKMSAVMRQVYDDAFFVNDLGVPQDKINQFLQYCDAKVPEQELFKKKNEFQLIDFLVTQSKAFNKL